MSGLDLIELQIGYTTILARYYRTVAPRTLVDGARTGIAAELERRGIATQLPYTPARVDLYGGGDLINALVLKALARYGKRLDGHRLVAAALGGELAALHDPYSVLFVPTQFKRFNAYLGNEKIGGIGAVLSVDDNGTVEIERVVPHGPAEAAGIRAGDTVVTIDGKAAPRGDGAALRDALRGAIGTSVHVAVARAGVVTTYAIVRAEIHDLQVTQRQFGSAGYLRLARFGERAEDEIATDLADLEARGATAFVLDLRGNGGGYGDQATGVAASFLGPGPVFVTRERGGPPVIARASGKAALGRPLVVLVDGDTASAAEIVAGAVQDRHAGTLLGARTFGKGLVQSVFPLPDGSAFKLTTARYTTPAGRDIDRTGIAPDIAVAEPPGATLGDPATDPQLAAALALLGAGATSSAPQSRPPAPAGPSAPASVGP